MLQTWYTLCVNSFCGSLAWIPGRVWKLFDTRHAYINNNLYEQHNFIWAQLRELIPAPPFHQYRWVQFMVEKPWHAYWHHRGLKSARQRVGESLRCTNPQHHQKWCTSTARWLNPFPYTADYFGHKVHLDENEKLVMYGVTHVCAKDGYSGKVVGFITMPVKNNVEIDLCTSLQVLGVYCILINYEWFTWCSRSSGTVQDQHQQGSTFTVNITHHDR